MAVLWSLSILLLSVVTLTALPTPAVDCGGKPADIVFLVDASSSIGRQNFKDHVRPFVSEVVDMFDVGPSPFNTRVGVVTFSDNHKLEFHLGDFLDKAELKDKILSIPINGGNTNTGEALTYVTEEMFKEEHGSRNNVSHIIVVLTDGASQNFEATRLAAEATHEKGLIVFAIGVGSQVDDQELEQLASDPDKDFKFRVTSFEALEKIKTSLSARTCEVTTLRATNAPSTTPLSTPESTETPSSSTSISTEALSSSTSISTDALSSSTSISTETPTISTRTTSATSASTETSSSIPDFVDDETIRTRACGGKPAEVYFILDSSGSIEKNDFSIETLNFVRSVSSLFDIGPDKSQTRVGIVTFSDDVTQIFPLNAHTSRDELLAAISPENISHKAQGTNTADALRFVQERGFASDVARQNVAHVAIIITDGQSENMEATVEAASAARRSGMYVFAIGVGKSADKQELKDISSDPDSKFVFTVRDYAALMEIRNLLAIRTCRVEEPEDFDFKDQAVCGLNDAELVFVYDAFSMGMKATRLISTEASQIASTISRRVDNLSVGMISENCPTDVNIPLKSAVTFARQSLLIQDTITSKIASLVKDARWKWFSKKQVSGRQVMILFVDETSLENAEDLLSQARYAQIKGIEVFVVTLGEVNSLLSSGLASQPRDDHVIHVQDARQLSKFRNMITESLCEDHMAVKTTEEVQQTTTTMFVPKRNIE